MSKCIEIIQTGCECEASVCTSVTSFNIKAKVESVPGQGKRLKITINPSLNSCSEYELAFDGSQLPENLVRDWLKGILNQGQNLHAFKVVNSNKRERKREYEDSDIE